jgi:hypothetical protein
VVVVAVDVTLPLDKKRGTWNFVSAVLTGSPGWANFRLLGDSFLWAVFRKVQKQAIFGDMHTILRKKFCDINLSKSVLGYILGVFGLTYMVTLDVKRI